MYGVKFFSYFSQIAEFLNENPLYECVQVIYVGVAGDYSPYKLLYKIQEPLS